MTVFFAMLAMIQAPVESPLKPLAGVAHHVEKGVNTFLKGETPAAALAPWTAGASGEQKLREDLKSAGIVQAEILGFEYEISFYKAGAEVGRLTTFAYVEGESVSFMFFEYRPGRQIVNRELPLEKVKAFEPRLADVATVFVAAIRQKKEEAVVFADPEKVAKRIGDERMAAASARSVEKGKKEAATACAAIAALEYDELRVGLDDVSLLARQEGGAAVGTISADFQRNEEKLSFNLDKYRPFKK